MLGFQLLSLAAPSLIRDVSAHVFISTASPFVISEMPQLRNVKHLLQSAWRKAAQNAGTCSREQHPAAMGHTAKGVGELLGTGRCSTWG